MLEVLGTGRARTASPASHDGDGAVRFLVIVARSESQLFLRTCIRFFGNLAVEVLLDRRRRARRQTTQPFAPDRRRGDRRHSADYWEDLRHHPVMIVPAMPAGRDVTIPQYPTTSKGEIMDTIDDFADTKARLDQWTREGQQLIGQVIPSLIDEWSSDRQQVQRLRQELKDRESEIAALRGEVEELKRERNEMVDATSSYLSEINRITTEVARRLKGTDDRVRKASLRAV